MSIKGAFDQWLDGRLGDGKTPNLPSRLIKCEQCKKIWHVNKLERACSHKTQKLANETFWNYLRSLLS